MNLNTHFVEVDEEGIDVRNQLKEAKSGTWLHDLIIDSNGGGRGLPSLPDLRTSTDDSTVFICVEAL